MFLEQCACLLEDLFEMTAREERQEEPHQWMIPIRPEQRERDPVYDTIAHKGQEEEHDTEHASITQPAHSRSFRTKVALFFISV
jgi:hypothetical protein